MAAMAAFDADHADLVSSAIINKAMDDSTQHCNSVRQLKEHHAADLAFLRQRLFQRSSLLDLCKGSLRESLTQHLQLEAPLEHLSSVELELLLENYKDVLASPRYVRAIITPQCNKLALHCDSQAQQHGEWDHKEMAQIVSLMTSRCAETLVSLEVEIGYVWHLAPQRCPPVSVDQFCALMAGLHALRDLLIKGNMEASEETELRLVQALPPKLQRLALTEDSRLLRYQSVIIALGQRCPDLEELVFPSRSDYHSTHAMQGVTTLLVLQPRLRVLHLCDPSLPPLLLALNGKLEPESGFSHPLQFSFRWKQDLPKKQQTLEELRKDFEMKQSIKKGPFQNDSRSNDRAWGAALRRFRQQQKEPPQKTIWKPELITKVVNSFPNITALQLINALREDVDEVKQLVATRPKIDSLEVAEPPGPLAPLLEAFSGRLVALRLQSSEEELDVGLIGGLCPNLKHLSLEGVITSKHDPPVKSSESPFDLLETLHLYHKQEVKKCSSTVRAVTVTLHGHSTVASLPSGWLLFLLGGSWLEMVILRYIEVPEKILLTLSVAARHFQGQITIPCLNRAVEGDIVQPCDSQPSQVLSLPEGRQITPQDCSLKESEVIPVTKGCSSEGTCETDVPNTHTRRFQHPLYSLRSLSLEDMPYVDSISTVLCHAPKLKHAKLHLSCRGSEEVGRFRTLLKFCLKYLKHLHLEYPKEKSQQPPQPAGGALTMELDLTKVPQHLKKNLVPDPQKQGCIQVIHRAAQDQAAPQKPPQE